MAREFKEVANLRTDKKKFDSNYDRIFGKKKEPEQIAKKYRITIEFDCSKKDLEDYSFDSPETIGDVERNVVKLFENDYSNVNCKIRPIDDKSEYSISTKK